MALTGLARAMALTGLARAMALTGLVNFSLKLRCTVLVASFKKYGEMLHSRTYI